MNRSLGVWCTLVVLLIGTFSSSLFSAPRLSVGTVRGFPGNNVIVPLTLSYASNDLQNVVALQADLIFDQSGLSSGSPSGGSALRDHAIATSLPASGARRILIYSSSNSVLSNGTILTLPFAIGAGQFRNFTIGLEQVILAQSDASEVTATAVPGGIAINQVYVRPDGNSDFFLNVIADQSFSIQTSTNLVDWLELTNIFAADPLVIQVDPEAHLYPYRFYRALPTAGSQGVPLRPEFMNPGGLLRSGR